MVMAKSLSHTKYMCKYHIVFIPKFRRKLIYNKLRKDIQEIIKQLCQWKGVEILEGHMMPDHVHLLLEIPPKMSVSYFMGYLKGKSSLMIFEKHSNLKYKFGNRNFWATGYYVSTVGLNEATIRKYIREQENEDKMEDKLTKKEYENRGLAKAVISECIKRGMSKGVKEFSISAWEEKTRKLYSSFGKAWAVRKVNYEIGSRLL